MSRMNGKRDISMRGSTFDAVKGYCSEHGGTPSKVVSRWIEERLDALGVPMLSEPTEPPKPTVSAGRLPPSTHGLVPYQKKTIRTGGYNEF